MPTDNRHTLLVAILLGLLVTMILIPRSPLHRNVPPRDSGVFLYMGQRILRGEVPYRDVWDHKGPGIYYLNALGLFLADGSRWGVWWLQWLLLMWAAIIGFNFLRQLYGMGPALFASIAWLAGLTLVLGGGNYAEQYALALQFSALFLFWNSLASDGSGRSAFLLGITVAATFWLRANLIGIHLSIGLAASAAWLPAKGRREALKWLLFIAAGVLVLTIPLLAYFGWAGAWREFVDAVFRYNLIYAGAELQDRLDVLIKGRKLFATSGLTFVALFGWGICLLTLLGGRKEERNRRLMRTVALVGLPVELLLATGSGRSYAHYFIAWLPVIGLLAAQLTADFLAHFSPGQINIGRRGLELKSIWLLGFLIAILLPVQGELWAPVQKLMRGEHSTLSPVVRSIWNYTDQGDSLLMWGAETKYNFMADRPSPSKYSYLYPLLTCGYVTDAMVTSLLVDIVRHKPLIIDTSASNGYIPPLNGADRQLWQERAFAGQETGNCNLSGQLAGLLSYLESNYQQIDVIRSKGWPVYQYGGSP